MIIGHGDIAGALAKLPKKTSKEGWIFFASGVSNSNEMREDEYKREVSLLMQQDKNAHIVYFGSLCIYYSNSRYARHKRSMEKLVKTNFKRYTIVRLGNITWGKNPNTIINYFKKKEREGKKLEIRDVYRYIINKNEFLHWMKMVPNWSCEMNITGKRMKVAEIVKKYVIKQKRFSKTL
ncbi:hypothetical protein C4564_04530 [Candidatus Microgenomates bacterium]|nr:MAG: hypothetical protein C4564_04530 [Candidatus Microgenomates bacterium]